MHVFNQLISTYGDFFSLRDMITVLSNPASWGVIGSLIILEGLLSADNALVLAVMVKHLNKHDQKKALFYGLIGAYVFRFIAIGIGVFLVKIWWIKILGGVYLLYLALKSLLKGNPSDNIQNKNLGFWNTVVALQLMDIAFSIDSVIAAFGISNQVWVLFIGGALGVLMMRGVATLFISLIEKVPELEATAFILIAIIGIKMILGAFEIHIDETLFFGLLVAIFLSAFVVNKIRNRKNKKDEAAITMEHKKK